MKNKNTAYEAYKDFIRQQPCVICGGASDPHHILTVGAHGENYYIIPLCRIEHTAYHSLGRDTFIEAYKLNTYKIVVNHLVAFIEEYYD